MERVDVIINVYGKPWQTLCTLKSLMKVSGEHIDKIYIIEERQQPYGANIEFIYKEFDNVIRYMPDVYRFITVTHNNMANPNERYVFRYQYGIENSDKNYVFITHNDILYTEDIIGNMLAKANGQAGVGLIGQCWNCPAFMANLCDGDRHDQYKPTYEEVITLTKSYVPARYTQHNQLVDRINPMPLPECRLNEFACIIDRNVAMANCYPKGNTPLFGAYDLLDLGDAWFRSLILKGFKFKNHDINKDAVHGYFSQIPSEIRTYSEKETDGGKDQSVMYVSGYPTQLDYQKYVNSEIFAENYFKENF